MDPNSITQIENIIKLFGETKELCSKLYKNLENAKNKSDCDELIKLYKDIISNLKKIKMMSVALDNIQIPEEYIGTDSEINQLRENKAKNIEFLAQRLRGCLDSFKKYNETFKNRNEEVLEI